MFKIQFLKQEIFINVIYNIVLLLLIYLLNFDHIFLFHIYL